MKLYKKISASLGFFFLISFLLGLHHPTKEKTETVKKPNILFCIADDWGWPHAGAYDDAVVKTPTFDMLASQGVLFENAFVITLMNPPTSSAPYIAAAAPRRTSILSISANATGI